MNSVPDSVTTLKSSTGITPEQARDARVRCWLYIFDCHAKKKAARPGGPDDGTKFKEDSADAPIIPE
jgi:hypothetical protein